MPAGIDSIDACHDNTNIIIDDVVLSSTQLSQSIDNMAAAGDSQRRRYPTFASVATFPCCCQFRLKPHGNSTFPLFYENNLQVDHFENISMHDLLKAIKKRIKDEDDLINKEMLMMMMMRKEFVKDYQLINENQSFDIKDQWTNFPVKSKKYLWHRLNKFPCSFFDFHTRFELQNGMMADAAQAFPLTLKREMYKFPLGVERVEEYQYKNEMKMQQNITMDKLRLTDNNRNANVCKSYRWNSLTVIDNRALYHNAATQFEWLRFPLKIQIQQGFDTKFPFLIFGDFKQMEINVCIKLNNKQKMENILLPTDTQLHQNSTKFPEKLKGENNKFPVQNQDKGTPTCHFKGLQINFISKTLRDIIPKTKNIIPNSYFNFTNKAKSKFPLESKEIMRTINKFPLKTLEQFEPRLIINQIKTKTFPLTFHKNQNKFPYKFLAEEINLNFNVKEVRQKYFLYKINKTLQQSRNYATTNYCKPYEHLQTRQKFPFKYLQIKKDNGNLHRRSLNEKELKFPVKESPLISQNFVKPKTPAIHSNALKFPLKLQENYKRFPFTYYSNKSVHNFTVCDVKQLYHSNKILKSLQASQNYYDIGYTKSITKFPLKERIAKKFYWKFPSENDIPIPLNLRKYKSSIDPQKYFTNSLNDNVGSRNIINIFTATATQGLAAASMTPDLYKQHWPFCQQRNTTTDDDNEKHASQVQFTQQVHVEENPFGTSPPQPFPIQNTPMPPHNDIDGKVVNILPAIEAKNISLTTTKTATEVGQNANNHEYGDAIINIRDGSDVSPLSWGKTLSQNIINSSFNEDGRDDQRECDDVDGILRASTPPMSAITSVQNIERLVDHENHADGDADGGGGVGDLCNPQVAPYVECSSDVRDTFKTTDDNGARTKRKFHKTVRILDKQQNLVPTTSAQIPSAVTPSPSPQPPPPPHLPNSHLAVVASISDGRRRISSTSFKENYLNSNEILPKYSVPELSESNAINCPEIDRIEIKDVTDQNSRQRSEKERAVAVAQHKTDDQVDDAPKIFKYYKNNDDSDDYTLDPIEIDEIYNLEFNLNDSSKIDEMKLEMKRSKGALPSTTPVANVRDNGKTSGTGSAATHRSSFKRSKQYAAANYTDSNSPIVAGKRSTLNDYSSLGKTSPSGVLRAPLERDSSTASSIRPTQRSMYDAREKTPYPSTLLSSGDRLTSATSRRLSNDYSSVAGAPAYSSTSSISKTSASPRNSYNPTTSRSSLISNYATDTATKPSLSASSVAQRYTNDSTTTLPDTTPTSKPKYRRRPTSGILLSLDLTDLLSSEEPLADTLPTINRGVSLDNTTTVSDVLPERTRLRRQRRFRPQNSQEEGEDPIERLNRLKARISASLSEVKGVIKQYSTEEEADKEGKTLNTYNLPGVSSLKQLEKVKEDPKAEKIEELPTITKRKEKNVSQISNNLTPSGETSLKMEDETTKELKPITKKFETSNTLTPSGISSDGLNDIQDNAAAKENDEQGPVTFRFVKKVRRRSFFTEDDEDNEQDTGKDEVDKSQSVSYLQKDTSPLKLPQTTDHIPQDNKLKLESNNFHAANTELRQAPIIKVEDNNEQSQDIGPITRIKQKTELEIRENNTNKLSEKDIQKDCPQICDLESNKPCSDQFHFEELGDNAESKGSEVKVVNKVLDKTGKLTKKVQNNKTKVNKDGNQQHEIKSGKSASKIPQRVDAKSTNKVKDKKTEDELKKSETKREIETGNNETKEIEKIAVSKKENEVSNKQPVQGTLQRIEPLPENKVNDTKIETKTNKIATKTETINNDNIKEIEISRRDSVKEICEKFSAGDATKSHTDEQYQDTKNFATDLQKHKTENTFVADIQVQEEVNQLKEDIEEVKDLPPKPKASEMKRKDDDHLSERKDASMTHPPKLSIKIEDSAIDEPKQMTNEKQNQIPAKDLSEKTTTNTEAPAKPKKKLSLKTKDPLRRASLAAVEGSKIEPPVKLAMPNKIQRRPSDSEAIVKKKLITTKTTTSGSVEEVTPQPKIVKVKRASLKKPIPPSSHQPLATTHQSADTTIQRNAKQQIKETASSLSTSTEANKSIQGERNKDVTMPNDEMLTQMPANDTKSLVGQIDRTQLPINETTTHPPASTPSLAKKTIEPDASLYSRATIENATATTTNLAASKFENSDGGAMLANSKPSPISLTTASAAIGPKETLKTSPQEDLLDLLQQEAGIFVKPAKKASNELKADDKSSNEQGSDKILEASSKPVNEPLEIPQRQVVKTTDIVHLITPNAVTVQVIATTPQQPSTSIAKVPIARTASSSQVDQYIASSLTTINQQIQEKQHQQQQQHTPTTTTTTIEEVATKTNDSPQISISSQEATTEDTPPTTSISEATLQQQDAKGLEGLETDSITMPELKVALPPVQTAPGVLLKPHKKNVIIKKFVRPKVIQNNKKPDDSKVQSIEATVIPEIIVDKQPEDVTVTASVNEDLLEVTSAELSTEESASQTEDASGTESAEKPKKVRKAKKKVIIKRQQRRLSLSGDTFFNSASTTPGEATNAEVETLEKPIEFVSDDEESEDEEPEEIKEKKPLKSCMNKKDFENGALVLYGERIKRTQIKWKKARVKERTSDISYTLIIDGQEIWSHINSLKKYTTFKVNFGTKEYLEIDYEQLAEEEEKAEKLKQRSVSIWNMV